MLIVVAHAIMQEAVENSAMVDANTQLQKAVARLCRQLHIKHESPHYRCGNGSQVFLLAL